MTREFSESSSQRIEQKILNQDPASFFSSLSLEFLANEVNTLIIRYISQLRDMSQLEVIVDLVCEKYPQHVPLLKTILEALLKTMDCNLYKNKNDKEMVREQFAKIYSILPDPISIEKTPAKKDLKLTKATVGYSEQKEFAGYLTKSPLDFFSNEFIPYLPNRNKLVSRYIINHLENQTTFELIVDLIMEQHNEYLGLLKKILICQLNLNQCHDYTGNKEFYLQQFNKLSNKKIKEPSKSKTETSRNPAPSSCAKIESPLSKTKSNSVVTSSEREELVGPSIIKLEKFEFLEALELICDVIIDLYQKDTARVFSVKEAYLNGFNDLVAFGPPYFAQLKMQHSNFINVICLLCQDPKPVNNIKAFDQMIKNENDIARRLDFRRLYLNILSTKGNPDKVDEMIKALKVHRTSTFSTSSNCKFQSLMVFASTSNDSLTGKSSILDIEDDEPDSPSLLC